MIEFKQVELAYNHKVVISRFSLSIERGDKVVIVGDSGIGKSSLFYLLLGFVRVQRGEIIFEKLPLNERSVWEIRKKIAYVDQSVSLGHGKVIEWFHSVFALKANISGGFPHSDIVQLCEYFEIRNDLLDKNIEDLSGGERQRLAIIMAIILKRKVFLLDEVTVSLDIRLKKKVVEFFMREQQWTVLVVSHDLPWLNHPGVKIYNFQEKQWKR